MTKTIKGLRLAVGAAVLLGTLSGCGIFKQQSSQECLARAMYFESNRSSRDGMIAVGTVVMNRVNSPQYPNTVCDVVGQKNQFARGVLSKRMTDSGAPLADQSARAVMRGERHPLVGRAEFFHAASYRAGYDNMHYVVTAGGNAFYERRKSHLVTQPVPLPQIDGLTGR